MRRSLPVLLMMALILASPARLALAAAGHSPHGHVHHEAMQDRGSNSSPSALVHAHDRAHASHQASVKGCYCLGDCNGSCVLCAQCHVALLPLTSLSTGFLPLFPPASSPAFQPGFPSLHFRPPIRLPV